MACGWWTGVIRGDRQLLRSVGAVATFDRAGDLISVEATDGYEIPAEWRDDPKGSERVKPAWATAAEFQECPVRVKRFWVPEHGLGVEDMPDILAEWFTDPAACLAHGDVRPQDAQTWRGSDRFVFHCGCGDYWLNRRGEVVAS
jgi:hypothetical protein